MATERRGTPEEQRYSPGLTVLDGGSNSSGPSSLERDERLQPIERRLTVEERKKNILEAEQERNDAALKKRMEREAALEARRNAARSTIAFAFGSSVPRNVESLQHGNEAGDSDIMSRSFTAGGLSPNAESHTPSDYRRSVSPLNCNGHSFMVNHTNDHSHIFYSERRAMPPPSWLTGSGALIGEDVMTKSMSSAISPAARGRRKNDLMPTVPYERQVTPRAATSSTRKRSVSMTRLDQLAQPRRHYVEANKANSTVAANGGATGGLKDSIRSPNRPLSSASEHSGGRTPGSVTLRMRSSPRKPRPISIAGTVPDLKPDSSAKALDVKVSPTKRSYTPKKRAEDATESRKAQSTVRSSTPKSTEKAKHTPRSTASPSVSKSTASKAATPKPKVENKVASKPSPVSKPSTPKSKEIKSQVTKKKAEPTVLISPADSEVKVMVDDSEKQTDGQTSALDPDVAAENEKNNAKRIISEEEARAALAEKRRLAREQAEREAELERQRLEELRREEEERLRLEEEEQKKMEEEQIRLLEEHRKQEDEKLRKAIEDQEQKEEEERAKRDEDIRVKAELEKKAKEEAEKQRLELEEKLRKEEEERAERKKRLEKIMSRTRGKSSNTSPSGSVSGSDQLDSGENVQEGFSSGANSLDSNEAVELPSDHATMDDHLSRGADSLEANNPTYEVSSDNASLNSNDLMMPLSETASQDNSLVIIPEKTTSNVESSPVLAEHLDEETDLTAENTETDSSKINADPFGMGVSNNESKSEEIDTSFGMENTQNEVIDILSGQDREDILEKVKADAMGSEYLLQFDSKEQMVENVASMIENHDEYSIGESSNAKDIDSLDQPSSSISSDIKLPDPIYETSEDGSVSSEKQQHDSKMFEEYDYGRNQINSGMDEVFSEHAFLPDPVSSQQDGSPGYATSVLNPFAAEFVFQSTEQVNSGRLESNPVADDEFAAPPQGIYKDELLQQQLEVEEDIGSQSSASSVVEAEVYQQNEAGVKLTNDLLQEDKENLASAAFGSSTAHFESDLCAEKENLFSTADFNTALDSELNFGSTGNRPFLGNQFSEGFESHSFHSQLSGSSHIQHKDLEESFKYEEPSSNSGDVTFIKSEENGACIGIISSVDHDQTANDFPTSKTHSEQFKNNFEGASVTDSEENSSLDSNLSQVMTVENENGDTGGLKEMEKCISETNQLVFSNGEQHNPFDAELSYNHDNVSKQNTNHFSAEIFSNGHRLDTSKQAAEHIADYVQGSDLLSVDPPKNNIFESVDAIDYNNKGSQDHPFLAKGSSNQIHGNPFLLQD